MPRVADPVRALSLCSGIGGLDLGVSLAVPSRVVGYVERDAYSAAVLLARMEEAALDPAPVWCGDLRGFDGRAWRGVVDLITCGFPCQPFSIAGQRRGIADERWIWPNIARIIRDVAPGFVFMENVPGLVQSGMPEVLGSLAELGYDATWDLFRASDVEAPHRRERWFCLAHSRRGRVNAKQSLAEHRSNDATAFGESGDDVGNTHGARLQIGVIRNPRQIFTRPFPPGPDDAAAWKDWIRSGGPLPALRRGADGVADALVYREDRLRCVGNAVVPQQAALAFRILARRLIP
jgi:DNA (cytosine-5)-methyltransferase 1